MDAAALAALVAACKVTGGQVKLGRIPTRADPVPGLTKQKAEAQLAAGVRRLSVLQERLYANAAWSVLVVVQAMDAAGKDGTIKHVMSGVNPQGIAVTSFGPPGPDDLAHDFLWRIVHALPRRGTIGVFNRSHYEEVLVPRVHPEVLERQHRPPALASGAAFWEGRLDDIAAFERHLAREGTLVLKFFLHVGKDEQRRRLLARLDDPAKLWKFDPGDVAERRHWDAYAAAYEDVIAGTAAPDAPWFIIPADQKWLMRLLVMETINAAIGALDLTPRAPPVARQKDLAQARTQLEDDGAAG